MIQNQKVEFEKTGAVWLRQAVSSSDLQTLDQMGVGDGQIGARLAGANQALDQMDWVQNLRSVWPDAFPVRTVAFNKSAGANWGVPWHQDRVIAVADRHEVEGYTNWTQKAGVWHCEPPAQVLQDMLFVRVYLDDANAENGAMEIAQGSHIEGLVSGASAAEIAGNYPTQICEGKRGDVQVLKMLTLHRSGSSTTNSSRRVFRVDFAFDALPTPLEWS